MPSAYSVPLASDVLPDPETPTTATIRHSGMSTSKSTRLWWRTPRSTMARGSVAGGGEVAGRGRQGHAASAPGNNKSRSCAGMRPSCCIMPSWSAARRTVGRLLPPPPAREPYRAAKLWRASEATHTTGGVLPVEPGFRPTERAVRALPGRRCGGNASWPPGLGARQRLPDALEPVRSRQPIELGQSEGWNVRYAAAVVLTLTLLVGGPIAVGLQVGQCGADRSVDQHNAVAGVSHSS